MKTGLCVGIAVATAVIGAVCSATWPVRETPPAAATRPQPQESLPAPVDTTLPAKHTELLAAPTAADEGRALLLGELVRQALASDDPAVRAGVFRRGLRSWVRADAEEAARFAQTITDEALREQVLRVVAQTWSSRDPEQAITWAAALPDNIERRVYLGAACIGLAVADPARAVQWADYLGLHEDGVLENLTAQWAARDEAAALTWVYQRPEGPDRDRLMQRIACTEAQTDPARAARLVVEQIPAGPEQTEAVISVVNQWAQSNPVAASAWVANFPPGAMQDRAMGELRGLAAEQ